MDLSSYGTGVIAGAVTFTGMVVVFLALIGLWAIVALFDRIFSARDHKPQAPAQSGKPAAPSAPVSAPKGNIQAAMQIEEGISDEIIAVIAGAIAISSGGVGVIRSVRRVREVRSSWAQAGLMQNTQPF